MSPPASVLLHGFTGSPKSFDRFIAALRRRGYRAPIVTPRLPGHHPSAPVGIGFADNLDRVNGAVSAMGGRTSDQRRYHLLGYSLGARIALGLAIRPGHEIERLTLIGVHPGLVDPDARARRVATDRALAERLRTGGIEAFVAEWQKKSIFATQARLPADILSGQAAVRLSHDPRGLADSLEHMGLGAMPSYRAAFANLTMSITLVVGRDDRKFVAIAEQLVDTRPDTRLVVLDQCGHNPVLERPDALAAAVLGER